MKRILLFLFFSFLGYVQECLANDNHKQELLDKLAHSEEDTVRLNVLLQLTKLTKGDYQERSKYVDLLQEQAEKQNNNKYKCHAYLIRIVMAYNMYDVEGINKWNSLLEPLARKENLHDLLFQGRRCAIDALMLSEQYELAEREALKMLKEAQELDYTPGVAFAYHSLSHIYLATYRSSQAFEVLEKAYRLSDQTNDYTTCYELTHTMIITCERLGDYKNWYKYLNLQQKDIKALMQENQDDNNQHLMLNYISFLKYYIKIESWEKATWSLDMINRSYREDYSNVYKYYYREAILCYYTSMKDWPQAFEAVNTLLDIVKHISESAYYGFLFQKAEILRSLGKEQEALTIYKETKILKDSLNIAILDKQTEQLKKSYNTDMLLLENEKNQQQKHLALIVLAGSIILVLVIFVLHTQKIKRKLTKAEHEMRVMKNDMEQANLVKERFLSNINKTIRPSLNTIVNKSFILSSEKQISLLEREQLSIIIKTTSDKLMQLINDILNLSKLESGTMKYNMTELEIIGAIEIVAAQNGVTIESFIPGDTECVKALDVNYFTQLLKSLLVTTEEESCVISLKPENTTHSELQIAVSNSILALVKPTQEITIRNEINRMLIEHFGGQYKIYTEQKMISIILPVNYKKKVC